MELDPEEKLARHTTGTARLLDFLASPFKRLNCMSIAISFREAREKLSTQTGLAMTEIGRYSVAL